MAQQKKDIDCRVCLRYGLKNTMKCLSIFETYSGRSIYEKINKIANVNIKEGDGLPTEICPDCVIQLETAVTFKEKCEASNKILWCNVLLSRQSTTLTPKTNTITKDTPLKEELMEIEVSPHPDEHCTEYNNTQDAGEDLTEYPDYFINTNAKKSKSVNLNLICDDCGGSFRSKCKLRVHWKKIHQPEKLICQKCKRAFKSYKAYNVHMKSLTRNCSSATKVRIEGTGKDRVFHCKDCNYSSVRIKDMDAHLSTHTGDRRFKCQDCSKSFTQHASLQAHRESTHKDYKIDTTCHLCGKHLLGRGKYYKHMSLHNQKGAQCKICNKHFKSHKYLNVHMLRHSGIKSYSCEVCAASFYTYCELYNHRKKVHFKSRNIKCDQCDYKMTSMAALRKHKAKHTATNVICLVCGQFMEDTEKLAIHQKRHFDRNTPCSQCDKVYHNKRSLYKHMTKVHRCTLLVEKKEDLKINFTSHTIKQESSPLKTDENPKLLSTILKRNF